MIIDRTKKIGLGLLVTTVAILIALGIKKKPTPAPVIPVSEFHFTEIVENHLPEYIIGWAAATCGGYYNYVPPVGYTRTSCFTVGTLGSHGGCPDCIMSQVRCDKIS